MIRSLRLLLFVALLLAPLGRIGMAEAAAPAAAMSGHCADMPGHEPVPAGHEGSTVDCAIACAAIAALPTPFAPPPPACVKAAPVAARLSDLVGIHHDAELPPPRAS